MGVKEDASNIFCVGVPKDVDAPFARADTTGAKLPNSVFGGNKTCTFAVACDHGGVGTAQTLLEVAKRWVLGGGSVDRYFCLSSWATKRAYLRESVHMCLHFDPIFSHPCAV